MAVSLFTACGDDEPELTIEDRLEAIAGKPLSAEEEARQLETADELCQLDDQLLVRLWAKLDDKQFEFQEFVFNYHCPQRSELIEGFVPPPTSATTTTTTSTTQRTTTTNPKNSGVIASSDQQVTTTIATSTTASTTTSPLFGGPDSTGIGEGG